MNETVPVMPASIYPSEDKYCLTQFLTYLLLEIKKVMGNLGKNNPKHWFPAIIATDNSISFNF